ncbi:MAG: hypothetical protein MUC49_02120 [Raineya sp.]|nr:hypothetical protein [Raineya sp.]
MNSIYVIPIFCIGLFAVGASVLYTIYALKSKNLANKAMLPKSGSRILGTMQARLLRMGILSSFGGITMLLILPFFNVESYIIDFYKNILSGSILFLQTAIALWIIGEGEKSNIKNG